MIRLLSFEKSLFIFLIVISISVFYFYSINTHVATSTSKDKRLEYTLFTQFSRNNKKEYYNQCNALFKKLRSPKPEMLFEVPPEMPPSGLREAFEDFGNMNITKNWYFSEKYKDSVVNSLDTQQIPIISKSTIEDIQQQALKNQPYGSYFTDTTIHEFLVKYNRFVQKKNGLVIGTIHAWIEALAMLTNASSVTTLDYTYKKYESSNMYWFHVNDYLDKSIKEQSFEQFDFSVSFSSIEHSGLGRYGDPLAPYGDLEAVQQIHCLLKPGGVFIIGLPCSDGLKDSYIEYNAHRVYGKKRLELLFGKDWILIDHAYSKAPFSHSVFFLVKV